MRLGTPRTETVTVVGGGVIGLSCAWRAALAGFRVSLHDPHPDRAASHVAGGMLAPLTEAIPAEGDLLELGAESLRRWPDFAAELERSGGTDPGLRTDGTLAVGVDPGDRAELERVAAQLARTGREVESLRGRELRKLEPALAPGVRFGLHVPGDLAVDNRALLDALLAGCRAEGVAFTDGRAASADVMVIAAGAWSGELHPLLQGKIRPVKGEILRLRSRRGVLPPPSRTVRAVVGGRHCYFVPRDGNRVVLGATQREVGFDDDVTAGGVLDLLRDGEQVVPAIAEYALEESAVGFRPGSPDNLPIVGELEPGVLAATGHHRGGILLAPITADAIVAMLRGDAPPPQIVAADPARLRDRVGGRA